jgi:peptidoglycan/LPS O-acetylase OafA/YrhL
VWPTIVFASFLILLSAGLLASHVVARRRYLRETLADDERAYRRRQWRRRIQASTLIGLVGIAVLGSLWVDGPPWEALYWTAVLLVVTWILVLASADVSSTRSFFGEVERRRADEHAALREEIERYRRHEGNGRRHHESEPPP